MSGPGSLNTGQRPQHSHRRKRAMSAVPPESPRASADTTEQATQRSGPTPRVASARADFGPNEWLVDELYQRYLTDPGSVDMAWWNFFADYQPPASGRPAGQAPDRKSTRLNSSHSSISYAVFCLKK